MKLEFHNPENIPASEVPDGWRFCLTSERMNPPGIIQYSCWPYISRFQQREEWKNGLPLFADTTYITSEPLPEGLEVETNKEKTVRLLKWFIEQFEGDSGTGASHWEQFPEFREAKQIVEELK